MYIVEVIPIAKGVLKENLSYFSSQETPAGSIVSIPLRKKFAQAIVVESKKAENLKSNLRASSFQVKKIEKVLSKEFISPELIKTARETAEYFADTTGSVLSSTLPKAILENIEKLKSPEKTEQKESKSHFEKLVIQASDEERIDNYKSLIREEFAKNLSVILCLPTLEEVKNTKEELEKGIEKYTFAIEKTLTPKKTVETWNKIAEEKHPVLVITAGNFLTVPREDLGVIILEKESSKFYKKQVRPFIDLRVFARLLAKNKKVRLLSGDEFLRVETLWRQKKDEYIEFLPLRFRSLSQADCMLFEIGKEEKGSRKDWRVIGPALEKLIQKNKEKKEHLFVLSSRRGLATSTVCGDCGAVVLCEKCKSPMVLHKENSQKNIFICHRCGESRDPKEKCRVCTGWRLKTLGAGVEKVVEEIRKIDSKVNIFRLDKDTASTPKKAREIVRKFYASPESILVGTEMSFPFLNQKVENSAISSLDSLFSLPNYRMNEEIFHLILRIRNIAEQKVLIQTRMPENKVFEYALSGNLAEFYREEIKEREAFNYPPFTDLIKITLEGKTRGAVEQEMEKLEKVFAEEKPKIFPAFVPEARGKYNMNALIKIPEGKWPDQKILEKLNALPPYFKININPDSVL